MSKMKTHKGAAKRFRVTSKGKIMRRRAFRSHILEKKSPKRKMSFGVPEEVKGADKKAVRRMLGE